MIGHTSRYLMEKLLRHGQLIKTLETKCGAVITASLGVTPTLCLGESQDTVEGGAPVQHKQSATPGSAYD